MKLAAIIILSCQIWQATNAQICEVRGCANITNHVCVGEKELPAWPRPCHGYNEELCYSDQGQCQWTGWRDQDNPSGKCDCEGAPEGCVIESYEIQLKSGLGPIYTDVSAMPQVLTEGSDYIRCWNSDQPGCTVNSNGYPTPWNQEECCQDYKVRFCCAQQKPKCYCCADDPVNECEDKGCQNELEGLGKCVDVTNADWSSLSNDYDLSYPNTPGLCGKTAEGSCCRCMKKKPCKDTGCKDAFKGLGVCINVVEDDLTQFNLDLTAGQDPVPGLCRNDLNEDCCSCFKKHNEDHGSPCYRLACEAEGEPGICIGQDDPLPNPDEYKQTDVRCNEEGDCLCWIKKKPCEDVKCRFNGTEGQCVGLNEPPPKDFINTGEKCLGADHCDCWIPENENCFGVECFGNFNREGICAGPNDPIPAVYENSTIRCPNTKHCFCHTKIENQSCQSKECEVQGRYGYCLGTNDPKPQDHDDSGVLCDSAFDCTCWIKRDQEPCPGTRCEIDGIEGECWELDWAAPNGWKNSGKNCMHENCFCWIPEDNSNCEGKCEVQGRVGQCLGPNDPIPLGHVDSGVPCDANSDCTCWIKEENDCYGVKCVSEVKGTNGRCFRPNNPVPVGWTDSKEPCDLPGSCTCWTCADIWSAKKCKKNLNKCNRASVKKNCPETCGICSNDELE